MALYQVPHVNGLASRHSSPCVRLYEVLDIRVQFLDSSILQWTNRDEMGPDGRVDFAIEDEF